MRIRLALGCLSGRRSRTLVVVLAALTASSCDGSLHYAGTARGIGGLYLGAEALSVTTTKKTLLDHGVGLYLKKDCSTLKAQQGFHWCRDYYENELIVPTLYCYRTLGSVSCYNTPSPYPTDRLVGVRQGGIVETD